VGVSWGRKATIHISDAGYHRADLIPVRLTQDITGTDEVNDLSAQARDLGTIVHAPGERQVGIEFERLIETDDTGDDIALLLLAYDAGDELYVVVMRQGLDAEAGDGIRFKAVVGGFPEDFAKDSAGKVRLTLKPSDPSRLPERVSSPYRASDHWLLESGDKLLLESGDYLILEN